ncbi:cupin domain-containing protein [Komagataeibacter melaceti]|mgnify:CR=1 FL=1|uniref:Cupin domain-containing protein n=1 Tax=Komagataeibacter melaceti TaxID=2766577 RepID=A0A371Z4Z8_9PROT|nr:cupin domain-containing protein [Komagataeibacter melaceti]RFD21519.1 cupin domain-containing protein [Komagataeibacter melaceti]
MPIRPALLSACLLAALAPCALAAPPPAAPAPGTPDAPQRFYRHLWTDDKGISHISTCPVHDFFLKSMSPPAGPQWQDPMPPQMATIMVTVQPAHWNGAWHPDPKPQWIIPLQGSWYVRAMDGTRVEMGPGDILFGEDQNVRPMRTGPYRGRKGHDAGNIGDGPVTLMVIQSANAPVANQPCRYR